MFNQASSRRIATAEYRDSDQVVFLEILIVLGIYQGRAYGTRISQLLDIVQKIFSSGKFNCLAIFAMIRIFA